MSKAKKVTVATTVEVLGHKLTRKEAEALYHELKQELKMVEAPVYIPQPYYVPRPHNPTPWYTTNLIGEPMSKLSSTAIT